MEAAEQQEKAASEAAQAAAAASFEAEVQAEKLTGVVKQLQVPLLLPDVVKNVKYCPSAETRPHRPQAFLSLDFQCRDHVSALK